jgi:hypothetical protein
LKLLFQKHHAMNPKIFADLFNRIAAVGGSTMVDGQAGEMASLFEKLQEGAAQPGMPGGLVRQNAYQAMEDYKEAAEMGQPVLGRRPKCNFHVSTEPIGHLTVIYV